MNSIIALGKFERMPLNKAWPTEDGNFTPWLAEPGVITLLGEALGMELEVEAVEHWVGSFRADILARSTDEAEHRVVIENQFGRTDHKHLGQVLTYLAGIENAKTIVWIAETIQPDHRAAIDWLNTYTADDFSFFAIEIELWRIDTSPPAPRFNVIASPNDWTRTARSAVRNIAEGDLAERHHTRLAYWASFGEFLKARGSSFRINRACKDMWFPFPVGRSGFIISATISVEKQRIGVELYIHHDADKAFFRALHVQKEAIERDFGEALDWQELPGKKATRIALFRPGAVPATDPDRQEQHAWMLDKMERFHRAFSRRVKALSSEVSPEEARDE